MTLVTKKHLSRRTFLRGAGVAVGLPLLEAMIPASTLLSQTAAAPKPRMGFIYFPHGAIMNRWSPAATGKDFQFTQILKPLDFLICLRLDADQNATALDSCFVNFRAILWNSRADQSPD